MIVMNMEYYFVLINGKGEYVGNMVLFYIVFVDKSECYLFCLIFVVVNEYFLFLIFGIRLIVWEMDGDEVLLIIVDWILFFIGERFDVELDL